MTDAAIARRRGGGAAIAGISFVVILIVAAGLSLRGCGNNPPTQGAACRDAKNTIDGPISPVDIASADLSGHKTMQDAGLALELLSPAKSVPAKIRPAAKMFYAYVHKFDHDTVVANPTQEQALAAAHRLSTYWHTCKAAPSASLPATSR